MESPREEDKQQDEGAKSLHAGKDSFCSMTSVDLMMAATVSPTLSAISSALRRVMTLSTKLSPTLTVTWAITSPSWTSVILPTRWLRAESFISKVYRTVGDVSSYRLTGYESTKKILRVGLTDPNVASPPLEAVTAAVLRAEPRKTSATYYRGWPLHRGYIGRQCLRATYRGPGQRIGNRERWPWVRRCRRPTRVAKE